MEDYAKRGYIHPRQSSPTNTYRDYSAQDIETAWQIKQLILIGYSHEEIAKMLESTHGLDIRESIQGKIEKLLERRDKMDQLIDYARSMQRTGKIPPVQWKE